MTLDDHLKQIEGRLDSATPEMTACFRRELGSGAENVSGRIHISFEVAEDGLVENLEIVESELKQQPEAELCVADTIRRLYFDEWVTQNRRVKLNKPFRFTGGR